MKVFEIELNNGKIFRVLCKNNSQVERLKYQCHINSSKIKSKCVISTGIHDIKQFEKIMLINQN